MHGAGVCTVEGDLRDPPGNRGPPGLAGGDFDLSAPVAAIVLGVVLHHVPDEDSPHKLVDLRADGRRSAGQLSGDLLMPLDQDIGADAARQVRELYAQASAPAVFRSRTEVTAFFEGLELVAPGSVTSPPGLATECRAEPSLVIVVGGVGRKP